MANKIEEPGNIVASSFVGSLSRYIDSDVIFYGDQNRITFKTYVRSISPTSPSDRFMVISPGKQYRPDLVSREVYGITDFWWKIMEVNQIWDIFDFKTGLNIRIPQNIFT